MDYIDHAFVWRMQEGMRRYTVIGLGPSRIVRKQMQLGPYILPKGTFIWAMLSAMHNSPRVWKEPEVFMPVLPLPFLRPSF